MANARVEQGLLLQAFNAPAEVQALQARITVAYNVPADAVTSEQSRLKVAYNLPASVEVEQTRILVAFAGRVADPRIQVWTSQLDNHEQYYLRLGDSATLVYDLYSGEWSEYGHSDVPFWRVSCGINWIGAQSVAPFTGSDILVGDDTYGTLYFLDPTQPYDDAPDFTVEEPRYFSRIVTGQVALRGRQVVPCYAAWLTTNMGSPAYEGASVNLAISDDAGATYVDMGSVEVRADYHSPELAWYSLGQMQAPGRLFCFKDDGAIVRIDTMEMQDPPQDEGDDKK